MSFFTKNPLLDYELAKIRHCPFCDEFAPLIHDTICSHCFNKLSLTYTWEYYSALQFNTPPEFRLLQYVLPLALYESSGNIRSLIFQFKYHAELPIGRNFGKLLAHYLTTSQLANQFDAIIPVPLHWRKYIIRGYNQARIFAQGLADSLQIPIYNALIRTVYRKSQTKTANHLQRSTNVQSVFKLKNKALQQCANKHLLVVDDVLTTGATASNCIACLLPIPNVQISFACIAIRPTMLREAYSHENFLSY